MPNGKYAPSNRQLIEEIHGKVIELGTVLLGVPGTDDSGLVGEVKSLKNSHKKLSNKFWILATILAGSGVVGVGELTDVINLFGG